VSDARADKGRGPATREKQKGAGKTEGDSFLETMESLIVAFILAFVFRGYVVEAFVIPTGSMAPRLNGQHYEYGCANCGYHYRVGVDLEKPVTADRMDHRCPLCFSDAVTSGEPAPFSGDRILVMKYFYDLFYPPSRWDVVVFKWPLDPTQNYIKRLVGLPGETVEVREGDVYIDGRIARKADTVQDALWMPVADTDYWDRLNGSRWRAADPRAGSWRLDGMPLEFTPRGAARAQLVYHHLLTDGTRIPIRDFYAYDNPRADAGRTDNRHKVTDLQLLAELELQAPGTVELLLRACADTFRFVLPAAGTGREARILHNGRIIATGRVDPVPVGRRVRLEAANVDHKLVLKVNGRRVIDPKTAEAADEQGDVIYEPTGKRSGWIERHAGEFPNDIRLGLAGTAATVHRLRINRDIYYTSTKADRLPMLWGIEGSPYTLAADEFFVLGDNSPRSLDSRMWDNSKAKVPWVREQPPSDSPVVRRENLIGKAFFVYWPAAGNRYGIPARVVPNLRKFRFIR
jgi:signal peptidase I